MNTINSLTIGNQLQQARQLMAGLTNPDGSIMFKNLDKAVLVQHTLRSTVLLNNSSTSFNIPVLQNSAYGTNTQSVAPDQNLLSLQDVAVCTEISVQVAKPSSASDAGYQSFSYAPTGVFSSANTAASIIGMFYNGSLKFVNNQQVIAPFFDLLRCYKAPNQQAIAAPYYAANTQGYVSEVDGTTDGFYPVQPMWVFNGGGNVQLTLQLAQALTAVETNEKLVVFMRCFLLQNASMVK
jgi:hypothetical protein